MLMMVDPHVHFHVFPRYAGSRTISDVTIDDAAWPGPPDLRSAKDVGDEALGAIRFQLAENWLTRY